MLLEPSFIPYEQKRDLTYSNFGCGLNDTGCKAEIKKVK